MDAFRHITLRQWAALILAGLAPIAGCTAPPALSTSSPEQHAMDAFSSAAGDALVDFLASLDGTADLTADRVAAALGIDLAPEAGTASRASGTLPFGDAGGALVSLYPDALDDSQRRMLVEFRPAADICMLTTDRLASSLHAAGYRPMPRTLEREPEPTSFVRGPVVVDVGVRGACVHRIVVR